MHYTGLNRNCQKVFRQSVYYLCKLQYASIITTYATLPFDKNSLKIHTHTRACALAVRLFWVGKTAVLNKKKKKCNFIIWKSVHLISQMNDEPPSPSGCRLECLIAYDKRVTSPPQPPLRRVRSPRPACLSIVAYTCPRVRLHDTARARASINVIKSTRRRRFLLEI